MNPKPRQHNTFLRVITMPYRALCKARDFYVNSITDCTNTNVVGLRGASQAPPLPRSFSLASSARSDNDSEDFQELTREASKNWRSTKLEAEMKIRAAGEDGEKRALPPRSVSVGMGRIDEELPLNYFGDDNGNNNGDLQRINVDGKVGGFDASTEQKLCRC